MSAPEVLVVGTYPPIPRPAADATLAEVRRAWDEGREVTVVSPRLSAAHLTVAVHGPIAGRRLDNVRRVTGATHLVFVVEEGYPFSSSSPFAQRATSLVLTRAFGRFKHVRLVKVASGALAFDREALGRLEAAADEVVVAPVRGVGEPGVTVLGPAEVALSDRPRQVVSIAARRILGPRAPQVRSYLGKLRRRFRS